MFVCLSLFLSPCLSLFLPLFHFVSSKWSNALHSASPQISNMFNFHCSGRRSAGFSWAWSRRYSTSRMWDLILHLFCILNTVFLFSPNFECPQTLLSIWVRPLLVNFHCCLVKIDKPKLFYKISQFYDAESVCNVLYSTIWKIFL